MPNVVREFYFPSTEKRHFEVLMPGGARILGVDVVNERPRIYALVDTEEIGEARLFVVYGTNRPIEQPSNSLEYVGTFHIYGETTWHLFEVLGQAKHMQMGVTH